MVTEILRPTALTTLPSHRAPETICTVGLNESVLWGGIGATVVPWPGKGCPNSVLRDTAGPRIVLPSVLLFALLRSDAL